MTEQTKKPAPSFLDNCKTELKRYVSAGQGEAFVLHLENFILETIKKPLEALNANVIAPKIPVVPNAIEEHFVNGALDKAEAFVEAKTKEALESLAPTPTASSSTPTEVPETTAQRAAPAPKFTATSAQAAFLAKLSDEQKLEYIKSHLS
jgi:hypothetical protein